MGQTKNSARVQVDEIGTLLKLYEVNLTIELMGECNEAKINKALHTYGTAFALYNLLVMESFFEVSPLTDLKNLPGIMETQKLFLANMLKEANDTLIATPSQKQGLNG